MHQKKKIIVIFAVVLFFCGTGVWYFLWSRKPFYGDTAEKPEIGSVFGQLTLTPEASETVDGTLREEVSEMKEPVADNNAKEDRQPEKIFVYVCGAVVHPGVYELPVGSRLFEAVRMAGGSLPEADEAYHNLARVVTDGERIYILSVEESSTLSLTERVNGEQTPSANVTTGQISANGGIVNLNTATAEDLTGLPGIGQSRAEDIIAYRNKVGKFLAIEEIMNISGIGEAMFERIKDKITVE